LKTFLAITKIPQSYTELKYESGLKIHISAENQK